MAVKEKFIGFEKDAYYSLNGEPVKYLGFAESEDKLLVEKGNKKIEVERSQMTPFYAKHKGDLSINQEVFISSSAAEVRQALKDKEVFTF